MTFQDSLHVKRVPWNLGKSWSEEVKAKISRAHKGKTHPGGYKRRSYNGMGNPQWGKHRPYLADRNRANAKYPKLSEEQVKAIFEQYKASGLKLIAFAKQVHMSNNVLGKLFHKFMPTDFEEYVESKLSKGNWYKRGKEFEYRVRDYFKDQGYFVLRSPRSGGPIDLVAIKQGEVLFIQCKSSPYLRPKEVHTITTVAESVGASPIFAFKEKERGPISLEFLSNRRGE